MLHSWIKDISLNEINNRRTLGITLDRSSLSAVLISESRKNSNVEWCLTVRPEKILFSGQPDNATSDVLKDFFDKLADKIGNKYVQVQVFLPDPLILYGFYSMDSVPDKPAQCRQLAGWRIGKQFHIQDSEWISDYQVLGALHGKKLLMATAIESVWLHTIQNMLYEAGILAPVINAGISHNFNQLEASYKQQSGALINITADYWTVIAWDGNALPRFVRSCWYKVDEEKQQEKLMPIAQEIIESLLVYTNEAGDTNIENIYIFGSGKLQKDLGECLNKQMLQPVKYFDLELGKVTDKNQPLSSQALIQACAAALPG